MPPDLMTKLSTYRTLLGKWGKVINLVAPSTLKDIQKRHFEDSLQLAAFIPRDTEILLDLGSGAGFPGLVLAMTLPLIQVHLVESDQRKCSFLATVSRETNTPAVIHNSRIEDIGSSIRPDVITARALADLKNLLRITEAFWSNQRTITLLFPKGAA